MSGKVWLIFDERAEVMDTDDCAVLEACSSRRDLRAALYFWRGHGGVLFEYDSDANNMLVNGRRVGSLREGRKALMLRCNATYS